MILQLSIFLYAYLAFLFVWLVFVVVAVYHMFRFGFKNTTTFLTTVIFLIVAVFMLMASFSFIYKIDWNTEIEILPSISNPDIII